MNMTLKTTRFAGTEVWLGSDLVQFDEQGLAVGVVQEAGGPPLAAPAPLTPGALEQARHFPDWFQVVEEEAPPEEPSPAPRPKSKPRPRRAASASKPKEA